MTVQKASVFFALFVAGAIICLSLFSSEHPMGRKTEADKTEAHPFSDTLPVLTHPDSKATDTGKASRQPFEEDEWKPGTPHPVEPEDTALPPSGKAPLRTLLGWKAEWYVHNSVCGFVPDPSLVTYTRASGKTRVTFSSGWTIDVDDATGRILIPPGLPALSDDALTDMTWRAFTANEGLERWRAVYRRVAEDGTVLRELLDVRLDEIRRVGDKAVVAWRLIESPPPEEQEFIRSVYWVDVRTGKIVYEGQEIHEDR